MAHTPGPWEADGAEVYATGDQDNPRCWVAESPDIKDEDRGEANARLIAAAPELLAAADGVRRVYGADDDEEIANLNSALLALNRAITKATGEQT